jgi:cyclopropane fatty-acyl-phospholipid synthase-like methyltransferase
VLSYVFMKILEARPPSYDQRINAATRGRVKAMKEAVVAAVPPGTNVLEVGCGTGELGAMLCGAGATVEAFDLSPSMVKEAERRIASAKLESQLSVREMGVDGMDGFESDHYGAVVSTLVLSELSDDERRFAIEHAYRVLKAGGVFVVADEVVPKRRGQRFMHGLARAPLAATTFLVSRTGTKPIGDLQGDVSAAGFEIIADETSEGGSFALVVARKGDQPGTPGGGITDRDGGAVAR